MPRAANTVTRAGFKLNPRPTVPCRSCPAILALEGPGAPRPAYAPRQTQWGGQLHATKAQDHTFRAKIYSLAGSLIVLSAEAGGVATSTQLAYSWRGAEDV